MLTKDVGAKHILEHYRPDDYLAAVLITRDADGRVVAVKHEYATADILASERRQSHFRAANAAGADVYLTVNALEPGTHNREKRDVKTIRHLYLDVDRDGHRVLERIMNTQLLPHPSTVIATSPGKLQILWRVDGFGKDEAEAVVRGMAAEYGADPAVWDCARILRVPGFRNVKYEAPFYAKIVQRGRSQDILSPADFPNYPELAHQITRGEVRRITPGHYSMSEREWGQVMRKLERGEQCALIESWLAHEASERGKPRPEEYARRTVENAVRRLRERRIHSQRHCPTR
jgi:hypothetical protein